MKTKMKGALAILLFLPFLATAQPTDPAIVKARADMEPVFALGRLFGYLSTMETQQPKLALSRAQAGRIAEIVEKINAVRRFDAKSADGMLAEIEDRILTPQQLQFTDQLALEASSAPRQNQSANTTGTGPLASYVAGGPFNPMTDAGSQIGKNFAAFSQLLNRKLGKQS
jgi:hypothetical protein